MVVARRVGQAGHGVAQPVIAATTKAGDLDQREKDINRCQEQLAQLPALRERLSDTEQQLSEISGLWHERDLLSERARRAEAHLAVVHNSRSWRLTAPLRRIGAPMRRIAGNS